MRLGILASHPIQYQAPWFRALARCAEVMVYFAHHQTAEGQCKAGFGVAFEWDVDLFSGYAYQFLKNVSPSPCVEFYSGCDTPDIVEIICKGEFDAFIVNGWYLKSYRQAMQACRRAGVPVLVRGDSHLSTPRQWYKKLAMEFTHRWLLRQFDGFLTVGRRNREYLEHFGAMPEQIFFVPHFIDADWFAMKAAETRSKKREVRQEWGADEKTFVVLFVGKLQAVKRPHDLLRALARLNAQHTHCSEYRLLAVFIGMGQLHSELRAVACKLAVDVHFAGFKNQGELPACYTAADVLVLPSESETWGLVVNEAMACGLPAIVSDAVGCGPDMIEDGRTGFVFPMGDVQALTGCLAAMELLKATNHDFLPALEEKIRVYNISAAVHGTLAAVTEVVKQKCEAEMHG